MEKHVKVKLSIMMGLTIVIALHTVAVIAEIFIMSLM